VFSTLRWLESWVSGQDLVQRIVIIAAAPTQRTPAVAALIKSTLAPTSLLSAPLAL